MARFIPDDTHIGFMKYSKWCVRVSLVLMVLSIALFFTRGLNYGIDFRGGTLIKAEVAQSVSVGDVRALVSANIDGDVSVTTNSGAADGNKGILIRISPDGEHAAMNETQISAIKNAITTGIEGADIRGVDSIGGAVSSELVIKGLEAIGLTLLAIGIYIWLRFEWVYSLGAIFALVHDVTLTIGVFALFGISFDLSIVAAILAIIGYSLNDTVVVYDRIREKVGGRKIDDAERVIDNGINETLRRTVMTSFTTLIAVSALYVFGGAELRGFSFAMIWGVAVGTYSSIFIASPVLAFLGLDGSDTPDATTKFADIDA